MAEPIFTSATERIYEQLPEYIRLADARQVGPDYPLKRWLACIADQQGMVEDLIDRFDFTALSDGGDPNDTSDLVDPVAADLAWLPWLAQLVGVRLDRGMTPAEQRDAVRYASSGWKAGTKDAVANAAKSALTGTKYIAVYDHSNATVNGIGTAGPWDVLLVTRVSETASGAAVIEAVKRKGAKPAGVLLHHRSYSASWSQSFRDTEVSTPGKYASWDALEADNGTWVKIEEAGL